MADLLAAPECAVVLVERAEGQVARARDVPRLDARAGVGLAALEPALATGIEEGGANLAVQYLLLGDDFVAGRGLEAGVALGRLAAFRRAAFGEPFLKAAVEDRDPACAEVAEHEPAARGGAD